MPMVSTTAAMPGSESVTPSSLIDREEQERVEQQRDVREQARQPVEISMKRITSPRPTLAARMLIPAPAGRGLGASSWLADDVQWQRQRAVLEQGRQVLRDGHAAAVSARAGIWLWMVADSITLLSSVIVR